MRHYDRFGDRAPPARHMNLSEPLVRPRWKLDRNGLCGRWDTIYSGTSHRSFCKPPSGGPANDPERAYGEVRHRSMSSRRKRLRCFKPTGAENQKQVSSRRTRGRGKGKAAHDCGAQIGNEVLQLARKFASDDHVRRQERGQRQNHKTSAEADSANESSALYFEEESTAQCKHHDPVRGRLAHLGRLPCSCAMRSCLQNEMQRLLLQAT